MKKDNTKSTADKQLLPFSLECELLFNAIADTQKEFLIVLIDGKISMMNKACKTFHGVDTIKEFTREFGNIEHRFVPHDRYFHQGKTEDGKTWFESLMNLPDDEHIVAMVDSKANSHAFSISIIIPVENMVVINLRDISTELIERIMIENDSTLDKDTGAYARDYLEYTFSNFLSAAEFTKKSVGISLIDFQGSDSQTMKEAVSIIKKQIRQDDMLVKWSDKQLLLVFLIDNHDNLSSIIEKIRNSLTTSSLQASYVTTIQREKDSLNSMVTRCEQSNLEDLSLHFQIV